jgi:SAM-dependent methyltransferase
MTSEEISDGRFRAVSTKLAEIQGSALIAGTISLGLRLGLYGALSDAGPVSSDDLAARTGYKERWLREWLYCQATAGVLDYRGDGLFAVSDEVVGLLVEQGRVDTLSQLYNGLFHRLRSIERLTESFKTGLGFDWDGQGAASVELAEQAPRNTWYLTRFIPDVLPQLDDLHARLQGGANAADIGCGSGGTLIALAQLFPATQFHGYEVSQLSLERGREKSRSAGVTNVTFHDISTEPPGAGDDFDFILTVDCLHDMTRPEEVVRSIRSALKPDGFWFIEDFNAPDSFEEALKRPGLQSATSYATSMAVCLSSSMSEADGAGLGMFGLPEPAMRQLVTGAGFTRFRRLQSGRPLAACYEARP